MKKIILVLFLTLPILVSLVYAEFNPFPENKGSIYYYDNENDVPDICFFGEGARWDGTKVTTKDWSKLTDYQKTMFISEGAEEIEKNEKVKVIWNGGWDILVAVNAGVGSLNNDAPNSNIPMIKFLRDVLITSKLIDFGQHSANKTGSNRGKK